jgi:hypothetical protein
MWTKWEDVIGDWKNCITMILTIFLYKMLLGWWILGDKHDCAGNVHGRKEKCMQNCCLETWKGETGVGAKVVLKWMIKAAEGWRVQALFNTKMGLRSSPKVSNFLSSWASMSFDRYLLHERMYLPGCRVYSQLFKIDVNRQINLSSIGWFFQKVCQ